MPKKERAQTCINGIRSNLREHPAQQNHQPIFAPLFWYVLIDFDWPRWPLNLRSMGFLADLSRSQVANANHVSYMYMCWIIYHCIFRAASKEYISIAPLIANRYSCGNIPWTVSGSNSARFGPVTSKQQKNWTQGKQIGSNSPGFRRCSIHSAWPERGQMPSHSPPDQLPRRNSST